jgi:DNA-binding NtrC family response regulator
MARILIADRVSERRGILCTLLGGEDHLVIPIGADEDATAVLKEVHPDLVITEGSVGGAGLVTETRDLDSTIPIIMILAGTPTVEQVVELMNQGVSEVLVSPLDINDVQTKVNRALSKRPGITGVAVRFTNMAGSSAAMQQVFRKMLRAAATSAPVLVLGEKGTGKKLVASQIHQLGSRKDRPFRSVQCEALGSTECQCELFGHEAGAIEGRAKLRLGELELADTGTLYLEEIHHLPPLVQARFVRFLEEQSFQRLGSDSPLHADVRLIAASTDSVSQKAQEGRFRSDLFYGLSSILIELPPLRARPTDIPEITDIFLSRHEVQIAGEALEIAMNYSWPYNLDELRNALEQAANTCEGNRIELKDLPPRILKAVAAGNRKHKFIPRPKDQG